MKKNTLRKVLRYASRYNVLIVLSMLLAVVTALLSLYVPILAGRAIDFIAGRDNVDFKAVFAVIIRMIITILIASFAQWNMNRINNKITFRVVRDVRKDAFARLNKLPLSYLDARQTGDIVSRVIADVDQIADGLLRGFSQLFTGIVTILGTLVFMFYLSFRISFVSLHFKYLSSAH